MRNLKKSFFEELEVEGVPEKDPAASPPGGDDLHVILILFLAVGFLKAWDVRFIRCTGPDTCRIPGLSQTLRELSQGSAVSRSVLAQGDHHHRCRVTSSPDLSRDDAVVNKVVPPSNLHHVLLRGVGMVHP